VGVAPRVLRDFEALLGEVYGKTFAPIAPSPDDLPNLKKWCSGHLERFPARGTRKALSLAGSLFLFRKNLSSPPGDPVPDYLSKMGRVQTPDAEFVQFIQDQIPTMFKFGWDRRYEDYCRRVVVSQNACTERGRQEGGARAEILSTMSRVEFIEACMGGVPMDLSRKVHLINDGGKSRIVTIATALQQTLLPLHLLLYDHFSKEKWLLRGDATANSFKEFTRVPGEVFVSGDYEAATDNLNVWHSRTILTEIFKRSRSIPQGIKNQALSSLTGTLQYQGSTYPQIAAQLMGNLLSFPLLCVMNALALKFVIRRPVPLRINGDDIVFRCTPEEFALWKASVGRSGLVLSLGKTMVHNRFFSMNSAFFEAKKTTKPSLVPVIRSKSIYEPVSMGSSVGARLVKASQGFWMEAKRKVKIHVLRWHRNAVKHSGCSLNRGLGVGCDSIVLGAANLHDREVHYLSQPAKVDKPARVKGKAVPGFKERPSSAWTRSFRSEWAEACRQEAWLPGKRNELQVEAALMGYRDPWWTGRHVNSLKITPRGLSRITRSIIPPVAKDWIDGRRKRGRVRALDWVPEEVTIPAPVFRRSFT